MLDNDQLYIFFQLGVMYQRLLVKKKERELLEKKGRRKYEYDSDEETDGGTWEHKARMKEMDDTRSKLFIRVVYR